MDANREMVLLQRIKAVEDDLAALSSAVAVLCRDRVQASDDAEAAEFTSLRAQMRKVSRGRLN